MRIPIFGGLVRYINKIRKGKHLWKLNASFFVFFLFKNAGKESENWKLFPFLRYVELKNWSDETQMDLPLINLHTCTVVDTNANFPFFPFMFILAIHPFVVHLQRNRLIDMIQSITSLQINKAFQQNNNTNVKSKVNKFIKKQTKIIKQNRQTNKYKKERKKHVYFYHFS